MRAYKGFTKDLTARLGSGIYQFEAGKTYREDSSKTARKGFHCCENPFECLSYYSLNGENRFFIVEAAGSIDEDDAERISCTELTLIKELTPLEFALEGMKYMIEHPKREKWKQNRNSVQVAEDWVEAKTAGDIAIARGESPRVKGPAGSILGLIRETESFGIVDAKLFVQEEQYEGKWVKIGPGRKIVEVQDEEEND